MIRKHGTVLMFKPLKDMRLKVRGSGGMLKGERKRETLYYLTENLGQCDYIYIQLLAPDRAPKFPVNRAARRIFCSNI